MNRRIVSIGLVIASLLPYIRSWRGLNSGLKPYITSHRLYSNYLSSPSTVKDLTTVFAEETAVIDEKKSPEVSSSDLFLETESGLKYKDTKVGTGDSPIPGDTVRVHYTGWLEDFESEKKFDSSYDRRSPLVFKVGVKQVIAGWDEALLTNMKVGGKRDIIIPASLGYGQRGAGGVIPPNATLYFKIELVGIGSKANK